MAAEDALRHQAKFWRFVGITTAIVLVIYGGIIVVVGVAAVFASGG